MDKVINTFWALRFLIGVVYVLLYVSSNSALLTPSSVTSTQCTLPLAVSAISGNIVIEGF